VEKFQINLAKAVRTSRREEFAAIDFGSPPRQNLDDFLAAFARVI
jgi:hypothetical protein